MLLNPDAELDIEMLRLFLVVSARFRIWFAKVLGPDFFQSGGEAYRHACNEVEDYRRSEEDLRRVWNEVGRGTHVKVMNALSDIEVAEVAINISIQDIPPEVIRPTTLHYLTLFGYPDIVYDWIQVDQVRERVLKAHLHGASLISLLIKNQPGYNPLFDTHRCAFTVSGVGRYSGHASLMDQRSDPGDRSTVRCYKTILRKYSAVVNGVYILHEEELTKPHGYRAYRQIIDPDNWWCIAAGYAPEGSI